MIFDPIQATDFYKVGHYGMYPETTEQIYSNMTARSNKRAPIHPLTKAPVTYVVNIGLQVAVKEFLIEAFDSNFFGRSLEDIRKSYNDRNTDALGPGLVEFEHIEKLWQLGYLPLEIKALPEGVKVPFGVPLFTIVNTLPEFYWLVNYFETALSALTWKTMTVATIASIYRDVIEHYARETGSPMDFVDWQGHDFSFRGMSGVEDAARSGIGHLAFFLGTDTVPALGTIENYYSTGGAYLGGSVPATEHSVMCAGGMEDELETYRRLIRKYNTGVISIVSDTWDYWQVLTDYTIQLKDEILNRQPNALGIAKVVFRPDSGDPVKIICGYKYTTADKLTTLSEITKAHEEDVTVVKLDTGKFHEIVWYYDRYEGYVDGFTLGDEIAEHEVKGSVEVLWDIFGGTTTDKGYKVLNQRIGLIYGDSITLERAEKILRLLKEKGFASCNIVFGIGSFTYQYMTRDTLGFAVKATAALDSQTGLVELFKDPKTDDGTKKSARGLLAVNIVGGKYKLKQQCTFDEENSGELQTVFCNGQMTREYNWSEVRENTKKNFY